MSAALAEGSSVAFPDSIFGAVGAGEVGALGGSAFSAVVHSAAAFGIDGNGGGADGAGFGAVTF